MQGQVAGVTAARRRQSRGFIHFPITMLENTDKDRAITVYLEEDEYQGLKQLKERYGMTWAGLVRQADFSHLRDAPSVANTMVAAADGGDAE
jgi:hypothetical protein